MQSAEQQLREALRMSARSHIGALAAPVIVCRPPARPPVLVESAPDERSKLQA